jgi:hypothetical protein
MLATYPALSSQRNAMERPGFNLNARQQLSEKKALDGPLELASRAPNSFFAGSAGRSNSNFDLNTEGGLHALPSTA